MSKKFLKTILLEPQQWERHRRVVWFKLSAVTITNTIIHLQLTVYIVQI